jgi:K+-transporting ATPase KdpF subunit
MHADLLMIPSRTFEMNTSSGYITGAVLALFIFAYLLYSLVKPEKF